MLTAQSKVIFALCALTWCAACGPLQETNKLSSRATYHSWLISIPGSSKPVITAIALQKYGDLLAAAGSDGNIYTWNKTTFAQESSFKYANAWVRALSFSSDDQFLIGGGESKDILLWNVWDGSASQFVSFSNQVRSIDTSTRTCSFAVGGLSNEVHVFSNSGQLLKVLRHGATSQIRGVRFLSGSDHLITLDEKANLYSWPLEEGTRSPSIFSTTESKIRALTYSPEGKRMLASGSYVLWYWPTLKENKPRRIDVPCMAYSLAFVGANTTAFGCSDGSIRLVDLETHQLLQTMHEHTGSVDALAYDNQSKILYSASYDKSMRAWKSEHFE